MNCFNLVLNKDRLIRLINPDKRNKIGTTLKARLDSSNKSIAKNSILSTFSHNANTKINPKEMIAEKNKYKD